MWHPASLLLAWILFALALQWLPSWALIAVAAFTLATAVVHARDRSRRLVVRSRWLLLSLLVLFLFLTPGEYLPGIPGRAGISYEGLRAAGEQVARLLAMLASLAMLHERLGTSGLMAGLYCLLGPWQWRERTVVRMLLVLEFAEQPVRNGWRDWLDDSVQNALTRSSLGLEVPALQFRDRVLIAAVLVAGVLWMAMA